MTRDFEPHPLFRLTRAMMSLPEPLVRRLNGTALVVDGAELDPHLQFMLSSADRVPGVEGIGEASADVATRRQQNRKAAMLAMPRAKRVTVVEREIPGTTGPLRVRVYRRETGPSNGTALVYFHGGGFVLGDLDTHDPNARILARITGATVVSVAYRLAPEHPFPAAVDDALAAYAWAVEHSHDLGADETSVAVMGDSAGGNLAAVVARRARDADLPNPLAQILIYPVTDLRMVHVSHDKFATGFFLTHDDMVWFRDRYLPDPALAAHPDASPLLAENLHGLPPALIITAGFDPLRDEGEDYAARLAAADVPVTLRREAAMIHGFFGMGIVPGGLARVARVAHDTAGLLASLRDTHHTPAAPSTPATANTTDAPASDDITSGASAITTASVTSSDPDTPFNERP